MIEGGCQCGKVRYAIEGTPVRHAVCTCRDCQRAAGAPLVAWAVVDDDKLRVTGEMASHNSSGDVQRQFCPNCGTGLFYRSESIFPGQVDVQSATFDDPDADPPTIRVQLAEAPAWLAGLNALPGHARYPG
ncbi:hypothetical protein DFR49_3903 [Hephaestia caeni]|uniref:CENP-V/GFA domain-containing protein n=1 Tax=Hephaestia caeni TaxID=645617 RepID=A0A397NM05_9SPHN|nr:GFA family protein [Hephaestia caeni]RIA36619.1 hypothetical protein DFR49_3903 [Hephaestia caeni]